MPGSSALAASSGVVLGEQAGGGALEVRECLDLVAEVGDLQPGDVAVLVLGDEGQVDDPDQPPVDEVDQVRRGLAVRLAAGPLDDQVVDRAHLVELPVQTGSFR